MEVVASWGVRDEAGEGGVASVFEREEHVRVGSVLYDTICRILFSGYIN